MKFKIIIDSREQKLREAHKLLSAQDAIPKWIKVEFLTIAHGDILLLCPNAHGNVLIERKTYRDLYDSTIDCRIRNFESMDLFAKKYDMKQVLLMEGYNKLPPEMSEIANRTVEKLNEYMSVWYTNGPEDTIKRIVRYLSKKRENMKLMNAKIIEEIIKPKRHSPEEKNYRMLCRLPGSNMKIAEDMVKNNIDIKMVLGSCEFMKEKYPFILKKIHTAEINQQIRIISNIPGIGQAKAYELLKKYEFDEILNNPDLLFV